ncbi:MAG TPA: patatin-like phospholipase family protein [Caulobacteraceae bacterium]|nr:patatin-like phospholipase family protein [Caulobacteraceae bacterium]
MARALDPSEVVRARLTAPGPKRILAIDGGGVRGALAIGMLTRLEATLRARLGRPKLVLADYFDLIGGTSTGAIIAAGLALGRDCANLENLYRRMGPRVFGPGLRVPLVQARFNPGRLRALLEEELGPETLGTAPWQTGFAAIAKRVDTGSPWVLTNSPAAKYWLGDPGEVAAGGDPDARAVVANKDYPLAKVVQASAAAPFFFDLVSVEVIRGRPGIFFDGAISPHNLPALQLAMTALVPAYGFGWRAGADRLMIVSVGTGQARPRQSRWVGRRMLSLWKAMTALMSLGYDSGQLVVSLMQWLGTSPQPWMINSEVGDLSGVAPGPPLWTFVRYDAPLEEEWLENVLGAAPSARLIKAYHRIDGAANIPALVALGEAVGDKLIKPDHFPGRFDPPEPASPPAPAKGKGRARRKAP